MNASVHDAEIVSYEVNLKKEYIKILVLDNKSMQKEILFQDVLTHKFDDVIYGSIILDIEKVNLDAFIFRNAKFLNERKSYA